MIDLFEHWRKKTKDITSLQDSSCWTRRQPMNKLQENCKNSRHRLLLI